MHVGMFVRKWIAVTWRHPQNCRLSIRCMSNAYYHARIHTILENTNSQVKIKQECEKIVGIVDRKTVLIVRDRWYLLSERYENSSKQPEHLLKRVINHVMLWSLSISIHNSKRQWNRSLRNSIPKYLHKFSFSDPSNMIISIESSGIFLILLLRHP